MNREDSRDAFNRENARILQAIQRRTPAELEKKILVPPQRGLEDSSRYWSAHMALEHVMIVGNGIADLVIQLSNGKQPSVLVDTATVKPHGSTSSDTVIATFDRFTKDFLPALEKKIGDLDSPLKHKHPWFGPMTAAQWFWLLGTHQRIHRVQIQEILKRV